MRTIKRKIEINASVEKVINIMLDFVDYPKFVPNIQRVEVLSLNSGEQTLQARFHTESAVFPKPVVSTQEIKYDLDKLEIEFRQTDGLLSHFVGRRRLVANERGVTFHSEVQFKLGSSLMARLAGPLLEKTIGDNVDCLLRSMKEEAESQRNHRQIFTLAQLRSQADEIFTSRLPSGHLA